MKFTNLNIVTEFYRSQSVLRNLLPNSRFWQEPQIISLYKCFMRVDMGMLIGIVNIGVASINIDQ